MSITYPFSSLPLHTLLSLALVGVLAASCRVSRLQWDGAAPAWLQAALLLASQTGELVWAGAAGVSTLLLGETDHTITAATAASHAVIMLQTLLQTLFIIDASHRFVL